MTRGIRNNNPGNLKLSSDRWVGVDEAASRADGTFFCFKRPVYGLRAIAVVLQTYQDNRLAKDGSKIDTVREVVERWAPKTAGNPTENYVRYCEKLTGVGPGMHFNAQSYDHVSKMVEAIVRFENAGEFPYAKITLDRALEMAGVVDEAREEKVAKRKQAGGSAVALTGAAATGAVAWLGEGSTHLVAETAGLIGPVVEGVRGLNLPWEWLAVLAVAGVAYVLWTRWRARAR